MTDLWAAKKGMLCYKTSKLWFYKLPAAGVKISAVKLKKQMPEKA